MKNLIQNLNLQFQQRKQTKAGRLQLAGGGAAILFVLVLLFSGSDNEPAQQHVFEPVVQPVVVEEKPAPPAPPNADNSKIILELFNPSDQSLTHQLNTTTLSQQIEQTMTISFVLTKCQLISNNDYTDTFRALVAYAERSKLATDATTAEATVRQIAESSKASYALVYSRTSCTDQQLPTLANQVLEWTRNVLKQQ